MMMKNRTIFFATSNENKFRETEKILKKEGINLERFELETLHILSVI